MLLTDELQRRFDAAGLRASAVALHPGVVQTDLGRYIVGGVTAGEGGFLGGAELGARGDHALPLSTAARS